MNSLNKYKHGHYIGVGASTAPDHILNLIFQISLKMALLGFGLRTQGFTDANRMFYKGAVAGNGEAKVYLPWLGADQQANPAFVLPTEEGHANARRKCSTYERMRDSQKKIRAATENLLFGSDTEQPAKFIVCWSPDGAESFEQTTGSTGEIIAALDARPFWHMPAFNLQRADSMQNLADFIMALALDAQKSNPPEFCALTVKAARDFLDFDGQ